MFSSILQGIARMLTAKLKAPGTDRDDRNIESAHFESEGSTFYDAGRKTIAAQRAGTWHAPDRIFISIDFESPVRVHFKNPELNAEEKFGPYERFRLINGGMWGYEKDSPALIAQFDASLNLWHILGRPAPAMSEFTINEA